ncbi:MAG TPA: DUF5663 domain-containing protein [Candidatus Saccharimonadales bacterium]|jgi:hypothetical protein|nr:DUF5663 domain-containing protein [Candidatus Saccharimonadales bacterium]
MQPQYITQSTLETLGIDLTGEDVDALLDDLNETLQERVGTEIAQSLQEDKLLELAKLQETATDTEIGAWLQKNVPDMQQIVQNEIDILIGEIVEDEEE